MKRKNNLIKFIAGFICLLCLASAATAQRRKPSARKTTRPAAVSAVVNTNAEIRAAAEKVSIQVKNLTKFIFVLGGVAKGIEDIDKDAQTGRASRAVLDKNAQFKQSVIQSISNLRAGLVALEIDFRAKPALRNYVFQIGGISDAAARAEEQAQAGQFTESGKTLLGIVEKLSDALVAMP